MQLWNLHIEPLVIACRVPRITTSFPLTTGYEWLSHPEHTVLPLSRKDTQWHRCIRTAAYGSAAPIPFLFANTPLFGLPREEVRAVGALWPSTGWLPGEQNGWVDSMSIRYRLGVNRLRSTSHRHRFDDYFALGKRSNTCFSSTLPLPNDN